jgi:hypothetical protein
MNAVQPKLFEDVEPRKKKGKRARSLLPNWRLERDKGMARAEAAADENWSAAADRLIEQFARTRMEFCGWEITTELRARKLKTGSERAMGPALCRAAKRGLIEKAGRTIKNPLAHGCPSHVWRSLVKTGGVACG